MNCKNCKNTMDGAAQFCQNCGAKVIEGRLSVKKLILEFVNKVFGWDNTYFRTFRTMVVSPDVVISDYINGVRKKFMPPVTFLLIGLTIATLLFNAFSDKYMEFSNVLFGDDIFREQFNDQKLKNTNEHLTYEDFVKERTEFQSKIQKMLLKHLNLYSFLLMPLYTFIAFLVFGRKKHNYAEHLVINAYIQGLTMMGTVFLFILALIIHPTIYLFTIIIGLFYYLYTYKKLYDLSFGKLLLKTGKFLIVLTIAVLIVMIIGVIVGIVYKVLIGG